MNKEEKVRNVKSNPAENGSKDETKEDANNGRNIYFVKSNKMHLN